MAGPWEKYGQAAPQFGQRPVYQEGPPQPTPRYADDARESEIEAGIAAATRDDVIRKAAAERRVAEAGANKAEREMNPITADDMKRARVDAATKINTIRQVRSRLGKMDFPNISGAGLGDVFRHIPATAARGIAAKLGTLKAGGALAELMTMSAKTGKNLLTPMSGSDVELISRKVGNLDQGQTVADLNEELEAYERAYGNGFISAGGHPSKLKDRNRADGPFPGKRTDTRRNRQPGGGVTFLGFE